MSTEISAKAKWVAPLCAFIIAPLALAVSPPPGDGYAGNNTAGGTNALFGLTSGIDNTALGFRALYMNTTGNINSAIGYRALFNNTTGVGNTANGVNALINNTTGGFNTALGTNALYSNVAVSYNTAVGKDALFSNAAGSCNTAIGGRALFSNQMGFGNTATGYTALYSNKSGGGNTGNGQRTLYSNTAGIDNTDTGSDALYSNPEGNANTANGAAALFNTRGNNNTAMGALAGYNLTSGNGNVCIGAYLGGDAGANNTTWIKNVYASVASARQVYVNSDDKIGTLASSRRYKEKIQPMAKASETLLFLRPVTFRYKKEVDPAQALSFGLIAEEVAEVAPELVTLDREGKPETVRYDAVNAMLLNEFLKAHKKIEGQEKTMTELRSTIAAQKNEFQTAIAQLSAQLKEQDAKIQRVSTKLEMRRSANALAETSRNSTENPNSNREIRNKFEN